MTVIQSVITCHESQCKAQSIVAGAWIHCPECRGSNIEVR